MIKKSQKQKLLKEITAQFGNVFLACQKIGIDKSSYYRWKEKDEKFKKEAETAEETGRSNIGDVAEYALLKNVRAGNQRAIEFTLTNVSKRYKPDRTSNVIFMHKKDYPLQALPQKSIEDLIKEDEEMLNADPLPNRGTEIKLPAEEGEEIILPEDKQSSDNPVQNKESAAGTGDPSMEKDNPPN